MTQIKLSFFYNPSKGTRSLPNGAWKHAEKCRCRTCSTPVFPGHWLQTYVTESFMGISDFAAGGGIPPCRLLSRTCGGFFFLQLEANTSRKLPLTFSPVLSDQYNLYFQLIGNPNQFQHPTHIYCVKFGTTLFDTSVSISWKSRH